MSRIGRMPIVIPKGVQVTINGAQVTIKGPKGELFHSVIPRITVAVKEGHVIVARADDERPTRALHGLTRALLNNMVVGVTQGYQKALEIVGVGYRVQPSGKHLALNVGFTHPVEVAPLPGITLAAEGTNRIIISGVDKQLVGQMAAKIRSMRPPDPYKGKGIRYVGERIKLKAGKAAAGKAKA
ncbi:MAG: 50S ribosomal protein L6 [Dehalococcoidia bacterium]|nr:50S ribosomal protein L6 [Dehalococcoidia bacterium]